jgi:hypothetical protein
MFLEYMRDIFTVVIYFTNASRDLYTNTSLYPGVARVFIYPNISHGEAVLSASPQAIVT